MANLLLALAAPAIPLAIWFFIIRPRLEGTGGEIGKGLPPWARIKAKAYAFRTWLIGTLGVFASELPGALQAFTLLDASWMTLEVRYAIGLTTIVAMMLVRGYSTTPANQPPL